MGVVDDQPLDRVGILRGEARGEHAAHRVADRHDLVDALVLEDELRVARLGVEVVGRDGLRRLAVPDLVRDDHAEPGVGQPVDDVTEVEAAEVVAVHQQDDVAVGGAGRRDVHIGDAHVLAVDVDVEILARGRIRALVAGDAARLDVRRRRCRRQNVAALGAGDGRHTENHEHRGECSDKNGHESYSLVWRCRSMYHPRARGGSPRKTATTIPQ